VKAKRTARLFATVILLFAVSAGFVSGCGRRAEFAILDDMASAGQIDARLVQLFKESEVWK